MLAAYWTILQLCGALAPLEPVDGKIMLGAWIDYTKETPTGFNSKLGHNSSFFHFAQNLPLDFNDPPPVGLLDDTDTNAALLLTVYPRPNGLTAITDLAVSDFVKQLAGWTKRGTRVFVRLAPEMNGSWFPFGQRPIQFIAFWRKVVDAVRGNDLTKGRVAFVWGPSFGRGYPYLGGEYSQLDKNSADFRALDTSGNQELDAADDPYSPYYPGDDYVDWVALSTYYFGPNFPWIENVIPPSTAFDDVLTRFYDIYAKSKKKPLMIAESGASFHVSFIANSSAILDPGPGPLPIKQAFWNQYITNPSILTKYPLLKAICLFEFVKEEGLTLRNFVSVSDEVTRGPFTSDLEKVKGQFVFAEAKRPGAPVFPGSPTNSASFAKLDIFFGILFSLIIV